MISDLVFRLLCVVVIGRGFSRFLNHGVNSLGLQGSLWFSLAAIWEGCGKEGHLSKLDTL